MLLGLYLFGQRFYQPGAGRFTQLDPLPRNLATPNRYAYVACNPANATDPTGLDSCIDEDIFVGAAILGYVGTVGGAYLAANAAVAGAVAITVTLGAAAIVAAGAVVLGTVIAYNQ